jgi:hypothetical protein
MVMHAHETRDHGVPVQVECRRAGRNFDGSGVAESGDAAALDDDRLIVFARATRTVDHADVGQRHDWRHRSNEPIGLAPAGRHQCRRKQHAGFRHLDRPIPVGPPARLHSVEWLCHVRKSLFDRPRSRALMWLTWPAVRDCKGEPAISLSPDAWICGTSHWHRLGN